MNVDQFDTVQEICRILTTPTPLASVTQSKCDFGKSLPTGRYWKRPDRALYQMKRSGGGRRDSARQV
jgi:hypothetical protein